MKLSAKSQDNIPENSWLWVSTRNSIPTWVQLQPSCHETLLASSSYRKAEVISKLTLELRVTVHLLGRDGGWWKLSMRFYRGGRSPFILYFAAATEPKPAELKWKFRM